MSVPNLTSELEPLPSPAHSPTPLGISLHQKGQLYFFISQLKNLLQIVLAFCLELLKCVLNHMATITSKNTSRIIHSSSGLCHPQSSTQTPHVGPC